MVQKSFCTPDEAMDPTCPSPLACLQPEKLSKQGGALFMKDKNYIFFKMSFSISYIRFSTFDHTIKNDGKLILPTRAHFRPQHRGFKHKNISKLFLDFFWLSLL